MIPLIRLMRRLSVLPLILASVTLFALMVLTFCDVVLRSAFSAPIEAATELTRIAIAIIVFASLPVLSGRGGHIAVDLLDPIFARLHLERLRDGIVTTLSGVMLLWPAWRIVDLAERARSYGDVTEYLAIPVSTVTWFIALMTFLTAAVLIARGLMIWLAPRLLWEGGHD
ncbi:TRAP transporter small permease subunit [Gemmobacter lutimaris]|uniref:TRAP transporter small permease protein n=1 Tax=Gemmobacter lutimaris TaxID=2306023 RepID=A0A398BY24_9RHOB|nr:TRAP transporter small permease subunit [Gemmobacter lutimaris]RID92213.1 TRAP transporter small permease subunit [Gemmobacter lutimaris]